MRKRYIIYYTYHRFESIDLRLNPVYRFNFIILVVLKSIFTSGTGFRHSVPQNQKTWKEHSTNPGKNGSFFQTHTKNPTLLFCGKTICGTNLRINITDPGFLRSGEMALFWPIRKFKIGTICKKLNCLLEDPIDSIRFCHHWSKRTLIKTKYELFFCSQMRKRRIFLFTSNKSVQMRKWYSLQVISSFWQKNVQSILSCSISRFSWLKVTLVSSWFGGEHLLLSHSICETNYEFSRK